MQQPNQNIRVTPTQPYVFDFTGKNLSAGEIIHIAGTVNHPIRLHIYHHLVKDNPNPDKHRHLSLEINVLNETAQLVIADKRWKVDDQTVQLNSTILGGGGGDIFDMLIMFNQTYVSVVLNGQVIGGYISHEFYDGLFRFHIEGDVYVRYAQII